VKLVIDIPVRTSTPGNTRRHWRAEARDAKAQREAAAKAAMLALAGLATSERKALLASPQVVVKLTRFSQRKLDRQNVFGALKHVIDGVADALGVDDGSDWYEWTLPEQAKGKPGVRVELEARSA
jgi:hypothetical protein